MDPETVYCAMRLLSKSNQFSRNIDALTRTLATLITQSAGPQLPAPESQPYADKQTFQQDLDFLARSVFYRATQPQILMDLSQIKASIVSAIDECFGPTPPAKAELTLNSPTYVSHSTQTLEKGPQQSAPPVHTPQALVQAPQQVPQNLSQYQAYQQAPQPAIQQPALPPQQHHIQDRPYDWW
jgi:hypothetical protein